jgi:hypothetical protein
MAVEDAAPERLQGLFRAIGFAATILQAERAAMKITLDCPRGRVEFRS